MASKPQRIAPPAIIAEAASALYAQIAASPTIDDAERPLWENAVTKAFNQLIEGVRFERNEDDFIFPSRTRSGMAHHVNGVCDCEASAEQGQPCWHRAAKRLVLIMEQPKATPAPAACPASPAQRKYTMIDPHTGDIAIFYDGELVAFAESEAEAELMLEEFLAQRAAELLPPVPAPPLLPPAAARPAPRRNVLAAAPARSAQADVDDLFPAKR
jgi:hypothetical protein